MINSTFNKTDTPTNDLLKYNLKQLEKAKFILKESVIKNIKKFKVKKSKYHLKTIETFIDKYSVRIKRIDNELEHYDKIIENDQVYQTYITKKKVFKERLDSLRVINEISYSINKDNIIKNVYKDNLNKNEAKRIVKSLKENIKENKSVIVYEEDYSFSDDSIDYEINPIINKNFKSEIKIENLIEILSISKTENDLNQGIKKYKKVMVKMKTQVENDFRSLLLMTKYLEINENN